MGRVPAIPLPGAFLKTVFLAVEWRKRRVCLTDFFLALFLLPLLLLCRCLFRLLAKFFDRFDTRRFQAILRNIPPPGALSKGYCNPPP